MLRREQSLTYDTTDIPRSVVHRRELPALEREDLVRSFIEVDDDYSYLSRVCELCDQ